MHYNEVWILATIQEYFGIVKLVLYSFLIHIIKKNPDIFIT